MLILSANVVLGFLLKNKLDWIKWKNKQTFRQPPGAFN